MTPSPRTTMLQAAVVGMVAALVAGVVLGNWWLVVGMAAVLLSQGLGWRSRREERRPDQ